MKWLFRGLIISALLLAGVSASTGAQFTLVRDGKPTCAIVIAAKPSNNAKSAAQELQEYVEKISGARLEIRSDAENVTGAKILVGRSRLTDAISGLKIPDGLTPAFREEGYVIHCAGDTLVLAGNDTEIDTRILSNPDPSGSCLGNSMYLGTRYAVYDLLNRLGVRWFAPGEYGEFVPRSAILQVAEVSVTERPDFPVRAMFACGGEAGAAMQDERDMWMVRNRMNPRSPMWFGVPADGSLNGLMPRDQVKVHPEWFALQADGTRLGGMPCMTDELRRNDPKYAGQPRLLDTISANICERAATGARTTDFSPDDGTPACLCDTCRKTSFRFSDGYCAAPPPGQEPGTPGDPVPEYLTSQEYFFFVNGLLDAVGAKYPEHIIATNGYANRYAPPEVSPGFNRHKNLMIMFADIVGCTIHRYDDPKCWQMRQQYNMLKQWCKISDKVWVYGYNYTILVSKGTITPMTKRIRTNIPMIKEAGAIGFRDQEWIDLSQLGLPTYVARFALEWDTRADVDAILADFYEKWFGPAAAPMKDYYEALETAFDSVSCHGHEDVILTEVYTPKLMARLADDIARAESTAGSDTEKGHVLVERLGFDHLRMYVDSLQAKKDLRFADAAKLMERMWAVKLRMRKISNCFGWSPTPYGMDWEAKRMHRLAAKTDGKEGNMLAPLPEMARFRTDRHDVGRSDRWMEPDYDDAKWQICGTTTGWQSQALKDEDGLSLLTKDGHPYRGYSWYRFTVDVPTVPQGKQARLFLPAFVNQGWAWVNGQYAGRTNYQQAWFRPQEMDLDVTSFLKPGKNVIAVRVLCLEEYFGANGLYERPFLYAKKQ
ncbi:MAG: DUF4838 domain-containing protein [Armatimonadota bacterium]|nr:DUF4838 domain-containing protein [Armatimonadota bacterium]